MQPKFFIVPTNYFKQSQRQQKVYFKSVPVNVVNNTQHIHCLFARKFEGENGKNGKCGTIKNRLARILIGPSENGGYKTQTKTFILVSIAIARPLPPSLT